MSGGLRAVPGWVDTLAELFSWVAIGFLIAQAGSWLGKDNFIVALALGVAAATLFPNFVAPVKNFIKAIFLEVFLALVELVEFLGAWLAAVVEHFQGNLLRAIVRIVTLAAFMWVWNLARQIPVIADLINLITEAAGKVTAWVNAQVDQLVGELQRIRDEVRAQVSETLAGMGVLGQALREDILLIVTQLFNGVAGELAELRFDLLARLDLVRAAARAELEVLGQRIRLVPQEVIAQLRQRFRDAAAEEERRLRNAAAAGADRPVAQAAPWVVVETARAELAAALAGVPVASGAQQDPLERELRGLATQAPAYLRGWLDGLITDYTGALEGQQTTAQQFSDLAVAELRAVLAGAPPMLPDLPRELVPLPPSPPAEPVA